MEEGVSQGDANPTPIDGIEKDEDRTGSMNPLLRSIWLAHLEDQFQERTDIRRNGLWGCLHRTKSQWGKFEGWRVGRRNPPALLQQGTFDLFLVDRTIFSHIHCCYFDSYQETFSKAWLEFTMPNLAFNLHAPSLSRMRETSTAPTVTNLGSIIIFWPIFNGGCPLH